MFFYKHNAYDHIQPGINEKNKHMISILSSLENIGFLLFSCLKSYSEAYSEPCQTSKMKLLPNSQTPFMDSFTGIFQGFYQLSRNTCFKEHLYTAASKETDVIKSAVKVYESLNKRCRVISHFLHPF